MVRLRASQQKILSYTGGKMAIAAVPGSGKTWTLSLLAAEIIRSGDLADDQEVLVVTLVNSAVNNFYQRVGGFIQKSGLIPNMGYRVRTLHGLAHDIVRERPGLVGLENNFLIIDERESDAIRDEVVRAWLAAHGGALQQYLVEDRDVAYYDWIKREQLPDLVKDIALSFIRSAKDMQLTPERLAGRLEEIPLPLPLAEMGSQVYSDYQRALVYRGAVDFDDLIRLALRALEADPEFLERLRYRWPTILEDEAQDSSRLQEEILKKLAGERGNWVRVGDPNQAIYETFTTANPAYLRSFMRQRGVRKEALPESGRSTQSIIDLANYLVDWTMESHPLDAARDALQGPPFILPTQGDDPQPNPADDLSQVRLLSKKFSPQDEVLAVADSLERWLPAHQDWTVAVLAPRNTRGYAIADELRKRKIPYEDSLLNSSSSTRLSAGALANLLRCLSDPGSPSKLATAYKVWRREDRAEDEPRQKMEHAAELLRKIGRVEDYLWPTPARDWLEQARDTLDQDNYDNLASFRELLRRWQAATVLPIDQVVLTLAQDLLREPTELAIAHKLAILLRRAGQANPHWRLPELVGELAVIARNERRFLGFSDDDLGFDPERHRGKVVISTMHKAKGLEWDRVYLMSVNNYDFPSGDIYDRYIAEKRYVRDGLNLVAEAIAQLETVNATGEYQWYEEGEATLRARLDYIRERLRLLYVGVTRARRELVVTFNTGRDNNMHAALPLVAMESYIKSRQAGSEQNHAE